jgi:putative acetyltransferase
MLPACPASGLWSVSTMSEESLPEPVFSPEDCRVDKAEEVRWSMEVRIRPETSTDQGAIREINEQAFGRPNEAGLVDAIRASAAFIPELSLVAERNGVLVGHVLFSPVTVEGAEEAGLLALGPIAVRPEWQRQGIGGELIRAGLGRAEALGYRAVILVGHPAYYPRFGFTSARACGLEAPFPVPEEVFMALPLRPGGLKGIHGTVVYPPAFSEV